MARLFAVQESGNGTTQTSRPRLDMAVHWGEAVKVTPRSNDALEPDRTLSRATRIGRNLRCRDCETGYVATAGMWRLNIARRTAAVARRGGGCRRWFKHVRV